MKVILDLFGFTMEKEVKWHTPPAQISVRIHHKTDAYPPTINPKPVIIPIYRLVFYRTHDNVYRCRDLNTLHRALKDKKLTAP